MDYPDLRVLDATTDQMVPLPPYPDAPQPTVPEVTQADLAALGASVTASAATQSQTDAESAYERAVAAGREQYAAMLDEANLYTDQKVAAAGGSGVGPRQAGVLELDDAFGMTNDDDRLAKLADQVRSMTGPTAYRPWIAMRPGLNTFKRPLTNFSGLKIVAPGPSSGAKNPEQGPLANHKIVLQLADGGAWIRGTGTVFDFNTQGLAVQANNDAQLVSHTGGTLYACELAGTTLLGCALSGRPGEKSLWTQVCVTGMNQWIGFTKPVAYVGGSDCEIGTAGYINVGSGSAPAVANDYIFTFETLGKTNIAMYLTAFTTWRGAKVTGQSSLNLVRSRLEGADSKGNAQGTLLRQEGGEVHLTNTWIANAMANPTADERGVIDLRNAAEMSLMQVTYQRGNNIATPPALVAASGTSKVYAYAILAHRAKDKPVIRRYDTAFAYGDPSVALI